MASKARARGLARPSGPRSFNPCSSNPPSGRGKRQERGLNEIKKIKSLRPGMNSLREL
jgi:hypothetical protein